jgi:hypothetical protein
MTQTADKIEEILVKNKNFKIIKFTNLKNLHDIDKPIHTIKGKSSIIPYDKYIWHCVQELLGQYEVINSVIKDVKPIFIDSMFDNTCNNFLNVIPLIPDPNKYFIDMFYTYQKNNLVYGSFDNIVFEELYVILDLRYFFQKELFDNHNILLDWFEENKELQSLRHYHEKNDWQLMGFSLLQDRFKSFLNNNYSDKKIYISRKDANKRHFNKEKGNTDFWMRERYFKDESLIEEYFESKGYKSYCFEGMSYWDQLSILNNATHIAGVVGSGFINTFICNPKTQIIEIIVKPEYYFTYSYLSEVMNLNHLSIDLRLWENNLAISLLPKNDVVNKLDEFASFY